MTALFQITAVRQQHRTARHLLFGLLLLIGFAACKSTSMLQHPPTIKKTTELKEATLALMSKGTEPYAKHKAAVDGLMKKLNDLYAAQKERKNNTATVQQFRLLLEDDGAAGTSGILTGFFKEWEKATTDKPLGKFFINEKKDKVAMAFDEILKLENAKPLQ